MIITDEMLFQNIQEARDLWLSTVVLPSAEEDHTFSKQHQKKMKKLFLIQYQTARQRNFRHVVKRTVAAILIVSTLTFSALMTVEAYRVRFIQIVTQVFQELTSYQFSSPSTLPEAMPELTMSYIPEGFSEEVRIIEDHFILVRLSNADNHFIEIFVEQASEGGIIHDTEDAVVEQTMIHGEEALLIEKNEELMVVWSAGHLMIRVSGNLEKEMLINVGKEIIFHFQ